MIQDDLVYTEILFQMYAVPKARTLSGVGVFFLSFFFSPHRFLCYLLPTNTVCLKFSLQRSPVNNETINNKSVSQIYLKHLIICLQEFVMGLSVLARGSLPERLQWAFSLYDVNGDGIITKDEMLDIVGSIYEMMGRFTEPQVDEYSAREHVDRVFQVSTAGTHCLNNTESMLIQRRDFE